MKEKSRGTVRCLRALGCAIAAAMTCALTGCGDDGGNKAIECPSDEPAERVLVVAPSIMEGFGMVPLESLAVGTPCVAYELPVLRQNYGDLITYRVVATDGTARSASAPRIWNFAAGRPSSRSSIRSPRDQRRSSSR